jgi:hypothetical protein
MEDDGGQVAPEERQSQAHVSVGEQVEPTRSNSPQSFPNQNRQGSNHHSLMGPTSAFPITHEGSDLSLTIFNKPINSPASPGTTQNITDSNIILHQSMSQHANSQIIDHSLPNNHQPTSTFNTLTNQFIPQSSPDNFQPITSMTFSPIITEALNNKIPYQFSFNANIGPSQKQQHNPYPRPLKINPTHKPHKNGPPRILPKKDPPKPVSNPTHGTPVPMESQTEKKRRRNDEEKNTNDQVPVSQYFLMAGPGSQACQDQ